MNILLSPQISPMKDDDEGLMSVREGAVWKRDKQSVPWMSEEDEISIDDKIGQQKSAETIFL